MAELLRAERGAARFRPAVDVYVSGEPPTISVELDAAGIDPDELQITIDGDLLVIEGERRRPPGRRSYQHAEIDWGPFQRRVRLPTSVDLDRVSATYTAGLLTIALPVARSGSRGPVSVDVTRRGEPGGAA